MTIALLWIQFAVGAAIVLGASSFLVRSADVIALKTGLGRTFIGIVLLATVTSLPELGAGVSSVALLDEPDLAAGDAFGSNLFNLLIIGLLEIFWRNRSVLEHADRGSVMIGLLGMAVIFLGAFAVLIHGYATGLSGWYISPFSVLLVLVFAGGMYALFRNRGSDEVLPPDADDRTASVSRAALIYVFAAAIVIGAAFWITMTADSIAVEMNWRASYVGTQFLALCTSLPELAASVAAMRLGAPELAISNLLGSNVFNMGFILFIDDLAYAKGSLWSAVSDIHAATAAVAALMTSVVLLTMLRQPQRRLSRRWPVEGAAIVGLYIAASFMVFAFG